MGVAYSPSMEASITFSLFPWKETQSPDHTYLQEWLGKMVRESLVPRNKGGELTSVLPKEGKRKKRMGVDAKHSVVHFYLQEENSELKAFSMMCW